MWRKTLKRCTSLVQFVLIQDIPMGHMLKIMEDNCIKIVNNAKKEIRTQNKGGNPG